MEIQSREIDDDRATLRLTGRLDLVSAAALRREVEEEVEAGRRRLVVDLGAVSFVDSSGVGALIAGLKRARAAGGELRIAGAAEQVLTVLRLTTVDRVLRPYATVDEALEGL